LDLAILQSSKIDGATASQTKWEGRVKSRERGLTSGARSDCGRLKNSPLVSSQLACPARCRHWELKVMCAHSRFKLTSNSALNMVYLPVGVRRQYPDGEANRPQLSILKLKMLVG
jgi:hypothetical protein